MAPCVMSIFGVEPRRIGGVEMFARELSSQLNQANWRSVLCFLKEPPETVRRFLEGPGVSIEVLDGSVSPGIKTKLRTWRLLKKHRPDILHIQFTNFLTWYPWLGSLARVKRTFQTDQTSRQDIGFARRIEVVERKY